MKTSLKIAILVIVGLVVGVIIAYFINSNKSVNKDGAKVFKQKEPTKYEDITVFYKKWFKVSVAQGNLEFLGEEKGVQKYNLYVTVAHNKNQAQIDQQLEETLIELLIRSCAHSYLEGISLGLGVLIDKTDIKIPPDRQVKVNCKRLEDYVSKFLKVKGFNDLIGSQIILGNNVLDMPNNNFEKLLYDAKLREEFLDDLPRR